MRSIGIYPDHGEPLPGEPDMSQSFGIGLKADKRNGKVMRRRRHGGAQALLLKGEIRRLRIRLPSRTARAHRPEGGYFLT